MPENTQPLEISPERAKEWLLSGEPPVVLDVRQPEEFEGGHLPGAQLIPISGLSNALEELPRGKPLLVYCQHGYRSLKAASFLQEQGFEQVSSLHGGLTRWTRLYGSRMVQRPPQS